MSSADNIKTILASLSCEQSAVVSHQGGHALVSAVAGSGKTLTLIRRVLYLLNQGVNKDRMLIVMYNRDIKEAFVHKLKIACKPYGFGSPKVFTYHSLGRRICERLVERGDLNRAEYRTDEILYRHHLYNALEKGVEEHGAKDIPFKNGEYVSEFLGLIDMWKGELLQPKEVINSVDYEDIHPALKYGYRYFEELRREEGYRTFADMIYDPAIAIRENLRIDDWVGNRYEHILIDEYQDINPAQQELIQSVAGEKALVMAVGDEDQCIYEWRGSRPDYMTGLFEQFFIGAKRYTLSTTYRFGHMLSCVANAVMYQNKKRTKKLCISWQNTPKTVVKIYQQSEEANDGIVSRLIRHWIRQGRRHSEIVILVRDWAMGLKPEMELMAAGIPCVLGDKHKSYKSRPEIQALVGFMALGLPRGLELFVTNERRKKVFNAMLRYSELHLRLAQRKEVASILAEQLTEEHSYFDALDFTEGFGPKVKEQLRSTLGKWSGFSDSLSSEVSAFDALQEIVKVFDFEEQLIKGHVQKQSANDAKRTVDSLIEHVRNSDMSLIRLLNMLIERVSDQPSSDAVLITSVHKAKGCEWPMVIIPMLEEGRFPHIEDESDEYDIEQERRLFYVAITRAVERLNLISPKDEYMLEWCKKGHFGAPKKRAIVASRFLYEMGLLRAKVVCSKLYKGADPISVAVGDKEFLYQSYLRKIRKA